MVVGKELQPVFLFLIYMIFIVEELIFKHLCCIPRAVFFLFRF